MSWCLTSDTALRGRSNVAPGSPSPRSVSCRHGSRLEARPVAPRNLASATEWPGPRPFPCLTARRVASPTGTAHTDRLGAEGFGAATDDRPLPRESNDELLLHAWVGRDSGDRDRRLDGDR